TDTGAGDEPGGIDAAIAVDITDQSQGRIRGRTLRPLAGVEIAIGREQLDVATLLGEDAALVDLHVTIGISADRAALQSEDALLGRRQSVGAVAAHVGIAARAEDVDVAAGLSLYQRARHSQVASVLEHRYRARSASAVVGVAERGWEQRRDCLIGAGVF